MAGATSLDINSFSYNGGEFFTILIEAMNYPYGISDVEVFATINGVNTDLGSAVPQGGDQYSFVDNVGANRQDAISLTLTDSNGNSRTTYGFDALQAGIEGQQYVAEHDVYDVSGRLTGADYYNSDGSILYHNAAAYNADQTVSYTYANGTFFDDKHYSSFTDTYSPDGTLITDARNFDSGRDIVSVETPGQTVFSQPTSLFQTTSVPDTTFVFDPGYGRDVVLGFQTAGRDHDVLSLPSSDFTSIADVLRNTQNVGNGITVFDPTSGDRLHLVGITKADLAQHRQYLALHA